MIGFAKRNLKVFFRDHSTVFFSLLSTFILIGLYVLFLGDVYSSNLKGIEYARAIMNSWIMAGLLATTSVTTTMGAFGFMVHDKADKINKDFFCSPITRRSLAGGYVLSALVIGFLFTTGTLLLGVLANAIHLSLPALVKVLFLILLTDFTNAAMMFFITTIFESNSAFSTASTIIGTLIGFLTGIYLPMGMLPGPVQWIIKIFPTSHAASLLRQVIMERPMSLGFAHVPNEYLIGFKHAMGVSFLFGSHEVSSTASISLLIVSGFVFFLFGMISFSKK